jgi:hypothetical protein
MLIIKPASVGGKPPVVGGIFKAVEHTLIKHDKGEKIKAWMKLQWEALDGTPDTHKKFMQDLVSHTEMVVLGVMVEGSQEVHLLHSCAMFGGLFAPTDLKGKRFVWLGDSDE